ncbi:hypothetical protein DERP_006574 [Dermatophagoides pteronyssinus]|uniref:Uncharacterized protein n=1 Tax=Dermatophagoides pteronyssinus TaxID=6956 RepID=A0ABQ8IQM2_DERPT|nr:hypothetical protein DERP_006574 [Dermatophagoides pteronyssinus]
MRDTEGRIAIQAICVFLHKMRSENSDNIIAVNWGIDSESLVSSYIKSKLKAKVENLPEIRNWLDGLCLVWRSK